MMRSRFSDIRKLSYQDLPRIPFEGSIDLTYRCNNHCRHCWLWEPENASIKENELTFDEIIDIADQALATGCRVWKISGGEPLLREDFLEIFNYLTAKAKRYNLNTNGTLITPEIAKALKRGGHKMVALYGATPEVYDHVTRHPGGFEKVMQGFAYLREAGVNFTVQLIPMKDNWHQWPEMLALAESLSPSFRVGAAFLYASCDHSPVRNREILAQRLPPEAIIELDPPNFVKAELQRSEEIISEHFQEGQKDDRLFAKCIQGHKEFHIDAYGQMSWCSFIKDPNLRYDLRKGTFQEAWEIFIPSCADKVHGGEEWLENCGACEYVAHCRWCAVYAYLEMGRYSAPIPYFCSAAKEMAQFSEEKIKRHTRYFQVGGIHVQVKSQLDLKKVSFPERLESFAVDEPGNDLIKIRHYFDRAIKLNQDFAKNPYRRGPWLISHHGDTWLFQSINRKDELTGRVVEFQNNHTVITVYHNAREKEMVLENGFFSLSLLPTDQLWLCQVMADRQGILFHSSAAIVNGAGMLFVGHSEAGKSTTMTLLKKAGSESGADVEVLCDDRNIIRRWPDGWRVHGTWFHGSVPEVSPSSAPLGGVFFLIQDSVNKLIKLDNKFEIASKLLETMITGLKTPDWWQKEMAVIDKMVHEIDFYQMHFDKSGDIARLLFDIAAEKTE
jgi:MoaA/NifB/PqqE/SkfB family radical SAM enzyme